MHSSMILCPRCTDNLAKNGETFTCSNCGAIYPEKNSVINFLHSLQLSPRSGKIQRDFDGFSVTYDSTIVSILEGMKCPWNDYTAIIEQFVRGLSGRTILDVGCGTSFPVGCFVPEDSVYIGLDLSLKMLEHSVSLMEKHDKVTLVSIDVQRIPLPENCVDTCLSLFSLNVFLEPNRAVEEITRVLKEDGEFFATVPIWHRKMTDFYMNRPLREEYVQEILSVFRELKWSMSTRRVGDVLFVHFSRNPGKAI